MRFIFLFHLILIFQNLKGTAQVSEAEIDLLKKLDSITNSNSIASHFAKLYVESTEEAVRYFQKENQEKRSFIVRFEKSFAGYFFAAAEAYKNGNSISVVWKDYFAESSLNPLQYELLGINAHINGDIWQALVTEFSWNELKQNRKIFLEFQKVLKNIYSNFHRRALKENEKMKYLHVISFGIERIYGKLMLKRWRKRQYNLVDWYYNKREKFHTELQILHGKMRRINRLILQHL